MFALRVDTFEDGAVEPVLTHIFYGETKEKAQRLLAAHARFDDFLRASLTTHRFGSMTLRSVQRWV